MLHHFFTIQLSLQLFNHPSTIQFDISNRRFNSTLHTSVGSEHRQSTNISHGQKEPILCFYYSTIDRAPVLSFETIREKASHSV